MSRYYIEFEKWNNLSHEEKIRQATLAYREERLGVDLAQMVSPYEFVRFRDGSFNYQPDPEAQFAKEESQAAENIFELVKEGASIVFWFSPPGGNYPDGRLIVAVPDKNENGEIHLNCRGMPLHWTPEKMRQMAEKLVDEGGMIMDSLQTPESLRSQPVGVKVEGEWTDFCEKTLGMKKLWDYIRWEKDLAEVGDLEKVVEKAYLEARGNSAAFERIMYGWGYRLNPLGNHGGSHMGLGGGFGMNMLEDLLGMGLGNIMGSYNFQMQQRGGEISVSKVKSGDKYYCPICGEEIGEGEHECKRCKVSIK